MRSRVLGIRGEDAACEFLLRNGCRLVARNYRIKFGEVDLIVLDSGCLCFVEVKARQAYQTPQDAVSSVKQKKLTQLAKIYLRDHFGSTQVQSRFDVIAIDQDDKAQLRIQWFKNAFDALD